MGGRHLPYRRLRNLTKETRCVRLCTDWAKASANWRRSAEPPSTICRRWNSALSGAISQGLPNIFWRIRKSLVFTVPPFVIAYLVYDGVEKEHTRLSRKQPGEFDNEVFED